MFLSDVFSWIVNGSVDYYKDLAIKMPKEFQARTDEMFSLDDSVTSYIGNKHFPLLMIQKIIFIEDNYLKIIKNIVTITVKDINLAQRFLNEWMT